ncbi:hypothetical protein ACFLQV_00960 [Calditrichota bacterium]
MSITAPIRLKDGNSYLQLFGIFRRLPISSTTPPDQAIDIILQYRPDVLYCNRFSFDILTREMQRKSVKINFLKIILLGGEIITDRIKEACRDRFGISPTEYYGLVETGILGFETPKRNGLHLNEDQVYYEFFDQDGNQLQENKIGNLIVTRFSDRAMPLIRYNVGDRVAYKIVKSTNGDPIRRITSIVGRDNEVIRMPDGKLVPYTYIARVINYYTELTQYRIIQEKPDFFRILVVGEKEYCDRMKHAVKDELDKLLLPLSNYKIERVTQIPLDESGKFRAIIPFHTEPQLSDWQHES